MTNADFRGANMKGVKLDNATLHGADFRGAILDEIDFYKVNTIGCLGCPTLNQPIQEIVR